MALYGSFVYGSGEVYGGDSSVRIVFVSSNIVRLETLALLTVSDNLYDTSNYSIVSEDGAEISVRDVFRFEDNRPSTNYVELLTDRHVQGARYSLTVANLVTAAGPSLGSIEAMARTYTPTKVDSILSSVPAFVDKRPGKTAAAFLRAFGLEDERIGGAVHERIPAD